ncbi:putative aldouronate transport system permease protein [Pilibacter termitis]|uniref:Putative aldouronate transport system permease protein n=1 Tax=Pilibacter termitis TaxID=263852 RepID=A0A1T4MAX2_9ENTE|nr:putative aldouronate transport system permease protein [Pilibacter termitis]
MLSVADVTGSKSPKKIKTKKKFSSKRLKNSWQLYIFLLPAFLFFLVFCYEPMYGVIIAWKDYNPSLGILGSPWVGWKHFIDFFHSYFFWDLIKNTLGISVYSLVVGFPLPIILALSLNELKDGFGKKFAQTITYAPNFISVVVIVGMIVAFANPSTGMINHVIEFFGGKPINFMEDPKWFKTLYVLSNVWQSTGWSSVIYMAALSGVDMQLHEAAMIDGASRLQRAWHINIPTIMPTIIILLIMSMGNLLNVGFEKIILMQNPLNQEASDVISTFVYRAGLVGGQYSFASAIGLFNSVINSIILIVVNGITKRYSENSLW